MILQDKSEKNHVHQNIRIEKAGENYYDASMQTLTPSMVIL